MAATAPSRARPDTDTDPRPSPDLAADRFLLDGISWETYEALLRDFEAIGSRVRMTYDEGDLEFLTLRLPHETLAVALRRLIDALTEELNIPVRGGRRTTFRKQLVKKGLEPDECYRVGREPMVRGKAKAKVNLDHDPAPDLAIEVEHTRSALDRLSIYAMLGFAEVWRYDGARIRVVRLRPDGSYTEQDHSDVFPMVPVAELDRFLGQVGQRDETTWVRSFRAWVRDDLAPRLNRAEGPGQPRIEPPDREARP